MMGTPRKYCARARGEQLKPRDFPGSYCSRTGTAKVLWAISTQRPACLEGGRQCPLVEIVEFTTHRDTVCEASDLHIRALQKVDQIVGGRLSFDGRIHGQDDFVDALCSAFDERSDIEPFRRNPIQCGECASEDMVASAKYAGTFERPKIGHVLDHA